eukprot:2302857-Pleurochrysis_carterae.AAC.1
MRGSVLAGSHRGCGALRGGLSGACIGHSQTLTRSVEGNIVRTVKEGGVVGANTPSSILRLPHIFSEKCPVHRQSNDEMSRVAYSQTSASMLAATPKTITTDPILVL